MANAPHSLEAEQAVLGGILLDPLAWERVGDKLEPADFYVSAHRVVFVAMQVLVARGKPVDLTTVSQMVQSDPEWQAVGDGAYLVDMMRNTPTAANVVAYADIVREQSVLRQLIVVSQAIAAQAYAPQGRASVDLLDDAERKVFDIAHHVMRGQGPVGIGELLVRTVDRMHKLAQSDSEIIGLSTGYQDFDRLTSGLHPGDLIVIAGRPSMGKTTFAMNIAERSIVHSAHCFQSDETASDPLHPVLMFSMEMPGESITLRLMSSLSQVPQQRLRTGQLREQDWARLSSTVELLRQSRMFVDDTAALAPHELRARARRVAREHGGLSLIVVDYLQLMQVPKHKENRTQEISEISRSLKALAKELAVPVIAISQLNRDLERRPNKRPVMSDLRESGAIEQDADLIVMLYRDEVYHEDTTDKGVAEIHVVKQRNGPTGTLQLTFFNEICRFENFAAQTTPQALGGYGT